MSGNNPPKLGDYDARELEKFERLADEVLLATGQLGTDGDPIEEMNAITVGRFFSNSNPLTPEILQRSISIGDFAGANLHIFLGSGYIFNVADLFGLIRYQQAVISRLMENQNHDKS